MGIDEALSWGKGIDVGMGISKGPSFQLGAWWNFHCTGKIE